jgi:hypothetical protein
MSDSAHSGSAKIWKRPAWDWALAGFVALCVVVAVLAPFLFLGVASGHDVAFHMASWLDAAAQWKEGVFFPRWTEWSNFGFGEPRFIFYPPLSWMFGALLGMVLPWPAVAPVFIACVQTLAGISAYALTRRVGESKFAAVFASACFAGNPYAILIIYTRSDFAELLAIALFPLLFLAALQLANLLDQKAVRSVDVLFFAMVFCAVWLSNAPAAVIATYSMALMFIVAAWQQRSARVLLSGGLAMVLGFGLASFYLLPAYYEQKWVNIAGVLSGGLTPAENFLYAKTADAEHDAFNRVASNIAVLLILWMISIAAVLWRRRKAELTRRDESRFFLTIAIVGLAAMLLMLPLTKFFWRILPELRFLQFPWRWMSVIAVIATVYMAAWIRSHWRWVLPVVAICTVSIAAHYIAKHSWWDSDDMPTLQAAINDGTGFEGTDEYDPAGDDRTDLPQKAPQAMLQKSGTGAARNRESRVRIEKWSSEHRLIRVATPTAQDLAVRLVSYPAWRVSVNGAPVNARDASATTKQMVIPVPAGESEVHIDFTRTWDRTLGGAISLVSVAASLLVFVWKRKLRKPAVS